MTRAPLVQGPCSPPATVLEDTPTPPTLPLRPPARSGTGDGPGPPPLHSHLHHVTPNGGISGVLVLAESPISIHTWPQRACAALDIVMCGEADPDTAIPVPRDAFRPATITLSENKRGMVP